jgi:hypothetical protein
MTFGSAPGDRTVPMKGGDPARLDRLPPVRQSPRGKVETERVRDTTYEADVNAARECVLMLKASHHPGWRCELGGTEAETFMVAPGFTAVRLPEGRTRVRFEYRAPVYRKFLLALGILTLAAVCSFERRSTRARKPPDPESAAPEALPDPASTPHDPVPGAPETGGEPGNGDGSTPA